FSEVIWKQIPGLTPGLGSASAGPGFSLSEVGFNHIRIFYNLGWRSFGNFSSLVENDHSIADAQHDLHHVLHTSDCRDPAFIFQSSNEVDRIVRFFGVQT